ncbi:DUF6316 family protein [Marinobacter mobilis]|uniref:DUF6316 domain-containing protein n=1 Tax=Marinobacter mobilis TaxID=488533 RepID=A0A1H2T2D6_9GAMM|nr:DUF6316 family protein [Marinobacter mobilis]SDW37414.1 hypothetical protein SAMN04487960_102302 [Marinobacter mobilis]
MSKKNEIKKDLPARFVETDVGWYVLTREETDLGPYPSLSEAKRALSLHLEQYLDKPGRPAYDSFNGFHMHDPQICKKTNCGLCAEAQSIVQKWSIG